ncbi:MAG: hypothetical protein WCA22_08550 [Candidatus Binatus sp.]
MLLLLSACSTQPPEQGSYFRTEQTQLSLQSTPSGSVNVDNRYVGVTSVSFPLEYEQQVARDTKNVTLWETQPGLSVFLTIISLGVYLPFSAIPVASETTLAPQEGYRHNHFQVTVDAPGYEQWKQELDPKGEKTMELQAQLVKKAEH